MRSVARRLNHAVRASSRVSAPLRATSSLARPRSVGPSASSKRSPWLSIASTMSLSIGVATLFTGRKKTPVEPVPLQDYEKDGEKSTTDGGMEAGVWQIPHDSKKKKGGEDTYVLEFIDDGKNLAVGVFDGVGGWAEVGVDPRAYSYALAIECSKAISASTEPVKALNVLNTAYTEAAKKHIVGSCTACVGVLRPGSLDLLNVGDSGVLIIRDSKVFFRSREQQHRFNMPFQLGTESSDRPTHGDRYEVPIQKGDIVIFGTDGLFDNLGNTEIADVVGKVGTNASAQMISRAISDRAYEVSKDVKAETPFYHGALKAGMGEWLGGKMDDITVLVVKVLKDGKTEPKARL